MCSSRSFWEPSSLLGSIFSLRPVMCLLTSWSFHSRSLHNRHYLSHKFNDTKAPILQDTGPVLPIRVLSMHNLDFSNQSRQHGSLRNSPPFLSTLILLSSPGVLGSGSVLLLLIYSVSQETFRALWLEYWSPLQSCPFSMVSSNLTIPYHHQGCGVPGTRAVGSHFVFLWNSNWQYWRTFQCQQRWSLHMSIAWRVWWCPFHV